MTHSFAGDEVAATATRAAAATQPGPAARVADPAGDPEVGDPGVQANELALRYPYAATTVLQGLTFTIQAGERILLLGTSGSGKSSLALVLNGLIPHSIEAELAGELAIFGHSTAATPPAQLARRVGIVFQDPESQFCMLTVADEVAFGLENLGCPREQMDERIDAALARVGLANHRTARLDRLSGGQKQRVAVAATLAMDPSLLLLDEATANLDPAGAAEMMAVVAELAQRDRGRTIVLIDHQLDHLIALVDRVLVIDAHGQLAHDMPPRQLFAEHGPALDAAGIWQPTAMLLAHTLRTAGHSLPNWPLTMAEALTMLRQQPTAWAAALAWAAPAEACPPRLSASAGSADPVLDLREIHFAYPNGTAVLNGIDLSVQRGEIIALCGPNGAGKTTLAQLMVGLLRPQQGTVRILGRDAANLSVRALAQHGGFVFQNPEHQFVADSVFDEVAFALRRQALTETEIRARVDPLLARLDLLAKATANPYELSQGQKRRLSVATMLVESQDFLVLDEPTHGQDARNTRELVAELRRLNALGLTLILVTHDMELVWTLAHRVAIVMDGQLARVETPAQLFADEALLAAAQLVLPARAVIANQVASWQQSANGAAHDR